MNTDWLRTAWGSTLLLIASTALGVAVAYLTRSDLLRGTGIGKPVLCIFHVLILWSWAAAWLTFWRYALNSMGGWLLALSVALTAAVAAELVQHWLPGHVWDWMGLSCNLAGVALAALGDKLLAVLFWLLPEA